MLNLYVVQEHQIKVPKDSYEYAKTKGIKVSEKDWKELASLIYTENGDYRHYPRIVSVYTSKDRAVKECKELEFEAGVYERETEAEIIFYTVTDVEVDEEYFKELVIFFGTEMDQCYISPISHQFGKWPQ